MILTFLALSANFNEDKLSYYVPYYDEQFTINDVLKRPDKESFSNLVKSHDELDWPTVSGRLYETFFNKAFYNEKFLLTLSNRNLKS